MTTKLKLQENNYYHIYNRGNNNQDIFFDNDSYIYFLRLYEKYIEPFAETYAWCLMKNHFHLLIYVKYLHQISIEQLQYSTIQIPKRIGITHQFSHLFNAYTQAINKKFKRSGSLFEKSFERKIVESERYFKNLIYYIHSNPVRHKFTDNLALYPWSSYGSVISTQPTKLNRNSVLNIYNSKEEFINYHSTQQDITNVKELIIEHY